MPSMVRWRRFFPAESRPGADRSGPSSVSASIPKACRSPSMCCRTVGAARCSALDGAPTVAFPGNGTITPAEMIENGSPIVVIERSLRPTLGRARAVSRRQRTGHSAHDGRTVREDDHPRRTKCGSRRRASPAVFRARRANFSSMAQPMALEPFQLDPGREVTLKLPGGGGYGDPAARDRRALINDIGQGLVTPEAARVHYGYEERRRAVGA